MQTHRAIRMLAADRRGSSLPVIIQTATGPFFTKLRGAAHGLSALVAEIIVAALAEALGLRVPERALIVIDDDLVSDDRDAELADLLRASCGYNLGFQFLHGALDFRLEHVRRVARDTAAKVVWLDGLVMNPDRTARNPNLVWWRDDLWLIDHGAALGFHHNWSAVTEESPRQPMQSPVHHVLYERATHLSDWDSLLSEMLDRASVRAAVGGVPDDFLRPLVASGATAPMLARRREAYAAFLWKRLKAPRPFTELASVSQAAPADMIRATRSRP